MLGPHLPLREGDSSDLVGMAAARRQVGVRAAFVHEASSVLAKLWPTGCVPADLLPSLLAAQCGACTTIASFRRAHDSIALVLRTNLWTVAPVLLVLVIRTKPAKPIARYSDL